MTTATMITGREPRLSAQNESHGWQRLSLRRLGTMLNVLPPEAISLEAAGVMLHSDDFYVRYNAARVLSQRGDREARLIMEAALTNRNVPTRASVARHLHRFSWFSAQSLLRQALNDPDMRVREGAVYALCDLREIEAFQLLTQALANEENDVLNAAAWSLRDCQDLAAVPVLEIALKASEPDVRVKALEALSANDSPAAAKVVRTALTDPDAEVVYNAVLSLIELEHERALPDVLNLIDQTHGIKVEPILRGFFHATNYLHLKLKPYAHQLLAVLANVLQDSEPKARLGAIWILAWLRHDEANAMLQIAYAGELDSPTKAQMLRIIVNLMNPVGAILLDEALISPDPALSEMATDITQAQQAGLMAVYDEDAKIKTQLTKPVLGR